MELNADDINYYFLCGQIVRNASEFTYITVQKMRFSIKDFLSKCDQIPGKPRIWSHLLKKSLMENFIFCAVYVYVMSLICLLC